MSERTGLVAHALRWHHGGRGIVDGVSLEVHPGEIVGLLGPNGAGKTVTLSMIAGLLNVTSGHVRIDGEDVTDLPLHLRARRGLGFLPQERSIFTKMSAEQNVAAILEARGYGGRELRAKARALLDEFGLGPLARSRAIQLSGGEQRRLEVARSLASDPRYLLFDGTVLAEGRTPELVANPEVRLRFLGEFFDGLGLEAGDAQVIRC